MRRPYLVLALAPLLVSACRASAQYDVRAKPRTQLVVHLAVDQLRPEYLERYGPQFTSGLARLLRGGAYFPNGYQDHGVTETAPGHASMMSGRFPSGTGIVANDGGVLDPEAPLLGTPGEPASPYRFRGSTLGDWMRFADPRARLLSVSRKDRSAILPLGRAKGEAFWYAPLSGMFTTSTWYADTLPTWVQRFNARRLPQSYAGKQWDLLLPASAYPEPDSVAVESGGNDYVFPHRHPSDVQRTTFTLVNYPTMDELTVKLALEGVSVRELGAVPGRTDFLSMSLSSTDAVGHKYGPDSREIHDQLLRLDRTLGVFIDSLYKLRDSSTIVFSFTSDHGVSPFPDSGFVTRYRDVPAGRTSLRPAVRALYQSLTTAGVDTSGFREDAGVLYLDPRAFARAGVNRDSVARAYIADVLRINGVWRAELLTDVAKRDTTADAISRRWLHMFPPDLPVMVVVTLKPFWTWTGVRTANHGSPHDYDARVPVLFYGAGVRPGRTDDMVRVVDIAPTLAALIDIVPQERLDGRVLTRVLK
ncbi:MAG: alkaline phosphatase family protein [Gemmatimonadaceae bacterium]|nr:alkaline phosphatase family protein [Gemmatimonadaceae bacterium]